MVDRLMTLFIASLDDRRIDQKHTPFLYELLVNNPHVKINNFPEVDLVPTILTGVYPHEHGMYQIRLKDELVNFSNTPLNYLPDLVTTTAQCLAHLYSGSFNLASIPPWRRSRFEILKARYYKRVLKTYLQMNGFDTFFRIIGEENTNYIYESNIYKLDKMVPHLFAENVRFEMAETHGCDTIHHWYSDDDETLVKVYNRVDLFIKMIHDECKKRGITLLILSDHGQEKVRRSIDLMRKIKEMEIQNSEITYYIESSKARFWFHSESAREKMLNYLADNSEGTLLSFQDMHKYGLEFTDDRYGEYFFVLNPGIIFFPNDFYHPLGNLYLGLTNVQMRPRLKSPVYRGYHGYLPHNDCEIGNLILMNDEYKTDRQEIKTIDIAPTILDLLGYEQPQSLKGRSAFHL